MEPLTPKKVASTQFQDLCRQAVVAAQKGDARGVRRYLLRASSLKDTLVTAAVKCCELTRVSALEALFQDTVRQCRALWNTEPKEVPSPQQVAAAKTRLVRIG